MTAKKIARANRITCRFKRKFEPNGFAMTAMFDLRSRDNRPQSPNVVEFYVCLNCGWLHLGHGGQRYRNAN